MSTGTERLENGTGPLKRVPPDALRVLVVADHMGYAGGVMHGVTTYFLEVLPALARAGVELTVCYLREPHPAADTLRERGISPVFLSAARSNPFVVRQIASIARRNGCAIMHAMGIKSILMARIAARFVRTRTILHLHDLVEPSAVVGRVLKSLAQPTDVAVCVSRPVAPIAVRRYGVQPDHVRVIHNGIQLERFAQAGPGVREQTRQSLGIPQTRRVMLLVGRMHPIKGHRTMLRAMPEILAQCPDALLLMAGDGPAREACEADVRELNLGAHVRILGQRNDIPELLQACDLLVMPSQLEGLGIAAIEAHAAGKPVVAFDVGGVGDVVRNGLTGRTVKAGDTTAFARATASLLLDDAALAALGSEARRVSRSFSLEAHVDALIRCYHDSLGTDAAGRSGSAVATGPGAECA